MIISQQHKYIYVAVPKTGTTSIQKFLLKNDPTACKDRIEIDGREYIFRDHNSALEISKILGEKYHNFNVFGFIRNPYSRIVSSYYFYQKSYYFQKNDKPKTDGHQTPWPLYFRIFFARYIPFKSWALLYPYKSNCEHLTDVNGDKIVNFIGTFERLKDDLNQIMDKLDVKVDMDELPHINKSKYCNEKEYFSPGWFKKLIRKKIQKDLAFYKEHAFKMS